MRSIAITTAVMLLLTLHGFVCPALAEDAFVRQSKPLSGHVIQREGPSRVARPHLQTGVESTTGATKTGISDEAFVIKQNQDLLKLEGPATDPWSQLTPLSVLQRPTLHKKPASPISPRIPAVDLHASPSWSDAQLKVLAQYDVCVLIDRSGSMATPDCNGNTRWEWCRQELQKFGSQTAKALPDGVDVVLFSFGFKDEGYRTLSTLDQIFTQNRPEGATIMAPPIRHCLERYHRQLAFGQKKRLLVAVITDGAPQDDEEVEQDLIRASRAMHAPGDIVLTFLRVGHAPEGEWFVRYLDDNLVNQGAASDIVDSESFDQLQSTGLLQALMRAIGERSTRP